MHETMNNTLENVLKSYRNDLDLRKIWWTTYIMRDLQ